MSTTTANYGWPVPEDADAPNVAVDMAALGNAIDTTVDSLDDRVDAIEAAAGVWTAYTPTYGGITIGDATVVARYCKIGKLVHVAVDITMGAGTSFSATTLTVSPPVNISSNRALTGSALGSGFALDSSVGSASRKVLGVFRSSASAMFFIVTNLDTAATVINTVPWTWAAGDILSFVATYESV